MNAVTATPFSPEAVTLSDMWARLDVTKHIEVEDLELIRCEDGQSVVLVVGLSAAPDEPLTIGGMTPLPFNAEAWRKAVTAIAAPIGAEVEVADTYPQHLLDEANPGPWRRVW